MKTRSKAGQIVLLLLVLGFLGFALYDNFISAPKGDAVEKVLVGEFSLIRRLPQAVPMHYHASGGSGGALVGDVYRTKLTYPDVRAYYDKELSRNGWTFKREEKILDWGRDFGGKTAEYCKGPYKASLQYAGREAHYDWDYALDLSWGLDSLYDKYKGRTCK
jgi:hypothetical protein